MLQASRPIPAPLPSLSTAFTFRPSADQFLVDSNAPRKRRSRWGDAKVDIPGLPTAISADGVSQAQLDNYAIQVRLEEINKKLRLNDYVPPENERFGCYCVFPFIP